MILAYILGLITWPVLLLSYVGVTALFSRKWDVECMNCGKAIATMYATPWIVAEVRWKVHYLRYWYMTRPEWTCQPAEK